MFNPEQAILALESLNAALEPISILCDFNNQGVDALHFSFNPSEFDRSQKLRLLRANFNLQLRIEQLGAIVEYTPYIFRKLKVNENG